MAVAIVVLLCLWLPTTNSRCLAPHEVIPVMQGRSMPPSVASTCVCNAQHCHVIEPIGLEDFVQGAVVYTSSPRGDKLNRVLDTSSWTVHPNEDTAFTVTPTEAKQTIVGFGGALTDAAAVSLDQMKSGVKEAVVELYFGPSGLTMSLLRFPIGGSDFSLSPWSYDDRAEGAPEGSVVSNFSINADLRHRLPLLRAAVRASAHPLKLIGSPWSAPAWMKRGGSLVGGGLKGEPGGFYHRLWARRQQNQTSQPKT